MGYRGFQCVRMKGLEPPRLTAPDPKSGAAANYATSAYILFCGVAGTLDLESTGCHPDKYRERHIRIFKRSANLWIIRKLKTICRFIKLKLIDFCKKTA